MLVCVADAGTLLFVEAEVSSHPDPTANVGAFALHGRVAAPDGSSPSTALLRIYSLDIVAGSSVQRVLIYSSDYRRAPLHLGFVTARVDNREAAWQPEPLAEPPPLGLGYQAGAAFGSLSGYNAFCIQRSVLVEGNSFVETHASADLVGSLLPEALCDRFEWWLRTAAGVGDRAASGAGAGLYAATIGGTGRLLPEHLMEVLPGGGLIVGYPRFELPGAAAAAATQGDAAASDANGRGGASGEVGASNSVGFFEAQLAQVHIREDGSAIVLCPANSIPGADASSSRAIAAAVARVAPSAVVVRIEVEGARLACLPALPPAGFPAPATC